ncbi:major head protein [Bacillus phage Harambe]|uniref:Major capsid protein n=1 Tax=Bacillus phage Harambe TaxID=1981931 RepID=A0A1W6JSD8_9CAUD|nr:major head protein [Bacillus phage Harambe]ARM70166.1 major capsid protein [Bacillus phage Harambe]
MANMSGKEIRALITPPDAPQTLTGAALLNSIRNEASDYYQKMVPEANADNLPKIAGPMENFESVRNEFFGKLVDRIGPVVMVTKSLSNPLAKFKVGEAEFGAVAQELFVDVTDEMDYAPDNAGAEIFARKLPKIHEYYHKLNRKKKFKQTISEEYLTNAFLSWDKLDNFVSMVFSALYNSDAVHEYDYMMNLVDSAIEDGNIKIVEIDEDAKREDVLVELRTVAEEFTLPMGTTTYNKAGVRQITRPEDVNLMITPRTQANFDVNTFAGAFNLNRADFLGNVTKIAKFKDPNVIAVVFDRNWFKVWDKLFKMNSQHVPNELYFNYWLHRWQIMSYSLLENAFVLKKKGDAPEPGDKELVVSPATVDVKAGETTKFAAEVKDKTATK